MARKSKRPASKQVPKRPRKSARRKIKFPNVKKRMERLEPGRPI
jgi:hypothetical protein